MYIKKETKRIVVTVKLEIDEDGVMELRDGYGGDIKWYLGCEVLSLDMGIKNILKIEEFEE